MVSKINAHKTNSSNVWKRLHSYAQSDKRTHRNLSDIECSGREMHSCLRRDRQTHAQTAVGYWVRWSGDAFIATQRQTNERTDSCRILSAVAGRCIHSYAQTDKRTHLSVIECGCREMHAQLCRDRRMHEHL
jgi:hypothetical protein